MKKQLVEKDNWTSADEKFFFERYEKLNETYKPFNLVNKALELIFQFGSSKCDAATRILEKYFEDFGTEDKREQLISDDASKEIFEEIAFARPLAFLAQGKLHYLKNEYDKCFENLCRIVAIEAEENLNVNGWLIMQSL